MQAKTPALTPYRRLEGTALWRAGPGAEAREVAARLGMTSLSLTDVKTGAIVAQWALAAIIRTNPGALPARYRPSAEEGGEELTTDDELLIDALERVRLALERPKRGRWLSRSALILGLVLVLAAAFIVPRAVLERAAAMAPEALRAQAGREALERLVGPGTGVRLCAHPAGRQALTALRNRLLGPAWRVLVIDGLPLFVAGHLPGRIVLLDRALVERLDSPEALAGWIVAQALVHEARDPMRDVLRHAGIRAVLAMLTQGTLPEGALVGYARTRLPGTPFWPSATALRAQLAALGIPLMPFVQSLPTEAARLATALQAEASLADRVPPPEPLLTDGEWLTLQAICETS